MLNNIVKVDAYEPKQAELGAEITIATKKSLNAAPKTL